MKSKRSGTSKRKPAAKKQKKASAKASKPAGGASVDAILAHLAGPKSPIGEPRPLTAEQLAACEQAAGVALSPSLYALLSFDAGWIKREYGWFDRAMTLQARPIAEVIEEHAGPWIEAYQPLLEARFAGRAIALDQGSDSMRLLYFGDPDARGEYPVLYIDHDDMPILGVEYATFEEWLAVAVGVLDDRDEDAAEARCQEILGMPYWGDELMEELDLPAPTPAPPPGSIARAPVTPPVTAKAIKAAPRKKLSDKQLDKALSEAAEERDDARLAELIAMAKERGRSAALDDALVTAARTGNLAAVTTLLGAGASANAREYYGCALARAVNNTDEVAIARALLAAGADPNGPSINGETVLHEAVENGSHELVRVLLEAGADPNREDENGLTPLTTASRNHVSGNNPSPALIDLMCDHGADPNAGKQSALMWAIEDGLLEHVARLIARGADLERPGWDGRRPLNVAYARGNDVLARQLIAAGADRTAKDKDGISIEHIFGADGSDIRPLDVHYVASEKMQEVVIEARLAVLNVGVIHTAQMALSLAPVAQLALAGHAAGAEFDPTKTRFEVKEDAGIDGIRKNGFVDRRWVIRVAGVSPRFMRVIAARLFDGAAARTGAGVLATLRGVSLSIRGELPGDGLDGATLRSWLADPGVQLGAFAAPLPFELALEPGGPPAVTIKTQNGNADVDKLFAALRAWLELAGMWPTEGFRLLFPQVPTKKTPERYAIEVMNPFTAKNQQPLPFTTTAYIDAEECHARGPREDSARPRDAERRGRDLTITRRESGDREYIVDEKARR
ncbi:MAG: hypothetical protein HOV81_45340 [Kofleriaceae bacterium]|nr:hypothetical protein [Kofleriaceae bacterium]